MISAPSFASAVGCRRTPTPTVRQRELGVRLRDLRIERGLTVQEVAAQLEHSGREN